MPSLEHKRARRANPDIHPDLRKVKRLSKNQSHPELQTTRAEAAQELLELRRKYKKELSEVEEHIAKFSESHPELAVLFHRLRERNRKNYEAGHEKIVQAIHDKLEKAYRAIPLSEQEIEQQLDTQRLSAMSLKEYVELLRRLPPYFFTHVTRQGIRDHFSHHHGGVGEYQRGFEGILDKGSLNSIYDQILEDGISHETVMELLRNTGISPEKIPTKEQAHAELRILLTRSNTAPTASRFADGKAIHAALEGVADAYYGGESANEIFVVWPTALIAKEYHIATQRFEVPEKFAASSEHQRSEYNDYWLLKKDERRGSLPLDAGIVFLPARAEVDPHTGSRYATNEQGKPIDNPQIKPFFELLASPAFSEISEEFYNLLNAQDKIRSIELEAAEERARHGFAFDTTNELKAAQEKRNSLQAIEDRLLLLCAEYDVTDKRILQLTKGDQSTAHHIREIVDFVRQDNPPEIYKINLENSLSQLAIQYKLADNPESSRAYWERYFTAKGKRPSKIVYYEGADPTAALNTFKEAAGITHSTSSVDLTQLYKDSLVDQGDIKNMLTSEAERIEEIGREIIEEMYSNASEFAA